ncbi:MAG: zinc ribbon domain-containing protein [Candidatus Omnitrophica bacterium]|nr:zinc ribbon domain-containing protein [Candidatus Omnitrophota bacterium]
MPNYQYECEACGHEFEHLQTMVSPKLTKCPKCAKKKLVRLIGSGAGMIFKGSGFYQTDYKNKGVPPCEAKPDSKSASPAAASLKPVDTSCCSGCSCHPAG